MPRSRPAARPRPARAALSAVLAIFALVALPAALPAAADPAMALARTIAERPANEGRVGTMHFTLTNSSGKSRNRTALMVHSDKDETIRIAIYFTAPAMISDTAFLSHDHASGDDENWLFLPATDRVRRLPTSDRAAPFMGTDLSFGDVTDNFKFPLEDWDFALGEGEARDGRELMRLEGTAKTPESAEEMGYSRFSALVDPETAFPVEVNYADLDGEPLKRVEVTALDQIGGAWTALAFSAENLQTGHRTEVSFTDMRYVPDLDDSMFDSATLAYGVPEIG